MHHTKTKVFQHSHHLVHDFSRAELRTRIVIGIASQPVHRLHNLIASTLIRAISGIAGELAFAMGVGALEVARFGDIGEFIRKTAAAFLYSRCGKAETASVANSSGADQLRQD